jgi:hypothetical protein
MDGNRQPIMKELVAVVLVVALLLTVGGCLVGNVVSSLRALDTAEAEPAPGLGDIEKSLQSWIDGLFPQKKATPPAQPAAPPADGSKPKAGAAKAEIQKVRFFEAGKEVPALKDRDYDDAFDRKARHIYCEVVYKNNGYKVADSEFPVVVQAYNAAGKMIGERKGTLKPRKEWATANFTANWGNDDPGFWQPGRYTVKIAFEGVQVGEYGFRVE